MLITCCWASLTAHGKSFPWQLTTKCLKQVWDERQPFWLRAAEQQPVNLQWQKSSRSLQRALKSRTSPVNVLITTKLSASLASPWHWMELQNTFFAPQPPKEIPPLPVFWCLPPPLKTCLCALCRTVCAAHSFLFYRRIFVTGSWWAHGIQLK